MVENNLMITRPDLCKEWNYNKNYPLRPEDVTVGATLFKYSNFKGFSHFNWINTVNSWVLLFYENNLFHWIT